MAGRNIHIGCGFSVGPSWENYDASMTLRLERLPGLGRLVKKNAARFPDQVRYGDILKGPLCAPGTADAVYCSHMLEHVALSKMRLALATIHRMLRPGGVFRLVVPDLEHLIDAYAASSDPERAHAFVRGSGLGLEMSRSGLIGMAVTAFGRSGHRWMYDRASMRHELAAAGFRDVREARLGDSGMAIFDEVEDAGRFEHAVALHCRR